MTDFFWPSTLIPARSSITLRGLTSRFPSPFTGTTRTYSRPGGELMHMRLDFPPLTATKGAALRGMLAKLRGGVNRVWCRDHSYVRRGSFPATELIANNTFANGSSGWTAGGSFVVADGVARLASTGVTPYTPQCYQVVNATAGNAYVLRGMLIQGTQATTLAVQIKDVGDALTLQTTSGSGGLAVASCIPTTSSGLYSYIYIENGTGIAAGLYFECSYTSVSRCSLVKGASQTGARILIDALPTSTNGLLLEGDQVQIGEELFIVAAPLNSNGSGEGYLTLHRPVRTSPADNAPVIIHEPMGLFMLAENENGWENVPGRFTNASVSLIEAVR